eukprot:CAMPEP_0179022700 /NCGR_PEP_ID=MMETSP0796-20121207/6546_1 /TAXON_ID=73915 /ORGANISM="Pyrodinium bahamense, Strain pbaha01" /LENGTH=383 /DNA_ID=CAMNT_0020718581 /DNA_START=20 /DNA_END=1169 /DNA_ORIENTATION=+
MHNAFANLRDAKAATGGCQEDKEYLGEFLLVECSVSSIDYIVQYALPVIKTCMSALCAERPQNPGKFLALHLLESACAPVELIVPVRQWLGGPLAHVPVRGDNISEQEDAVAERVAELLGPIADRDGTIDHQQLTRVMGAVDPSWPWKEEDMKKLLSSAGMSCDARVDCRTFSHWIFQTTTPGQCSSEKAVPRAESLHSVASGAGEVAPDIADTDKVGAAQSGAITTVISPLASASVMERIDDRSLGKPLPKCLGKPFVKHSSRPPKAPGKPSSGTGRSKSQPPKPPPPKAAAKANRGRSQPPLSASLSLAACLEKRRGELRSAPTHAPHCDAALSSCRDPEVVAAEERERPVLIEELQLLAARTRLGALEASIVTLLEERLE